jgi:hypothetical protein
MATPITVTIPHNLGKAEARRRLSEGFSGLQSQIAGAPLANLQQAWADDRLTFSAAMLGQRVNGRVDVDEREVRIEVDLPAFLAGFADKIAGRLKQQGTLLLEKK